MTTQSISDLTAQEKTFLFAGATEATIDAAIRDLERGIRPATVIGRLREGQAFAATLKPTTADFRADVPTENCRKCGRFLTLESERILAHRYGNCTVCGGGPETNEERGR